MPASLDPSYVVKHVVADLERVRALIQHEAEKSRRWELTERQRAMVAAKLATLKRGRPEENPSIEGISADRAYAVVNRLDDAVRVLCHAIDPNQHSTTVRNDALGAVTASELEGAAT